MTCLRCNGECTCAPVPPTAVQPELLPENDPGAWRREVSERLHRYRARRRPRGPRYPSLRLKFEAPEGAWTARVREAAVPEVVEPMQVPPSVSTAAVAIEYVARQPVVQSAPPAKTVEIPPPAPTRRHEPAKVIEFPAPAYVVEDFSYALAEPVLDRPRILEAPEVVPPPPAMGGITIEPAAKDEPERLAGIDVPLQSARRTHRVLAGALDLLIVLVAAAMFSGVFYRTTHMVPGIWPAVLVGPGLLGVFWFAYQYSFLVYCGTTPGLRILRLRLERFDGKPTGRQLRRARVLCHVLSLAALGMGYAWQFLDEDGLCWHERVTKTHIAVEKPEASAVP